MTSAVQSSSYTPTQIKVWLRGLLTVAWADGQFEASEKQIIEDMVALEFAPGTDFETLEPIEPADLADVLHLDPAAAQNFLRMAVMVALANGVYSDRENDQILAFAKALAVEPEALTSLQSTLDKLRAMDRERSEAERSEAEHSGAEHSGGTSTKEAIANALYLPTISKAVSEIDPLKPARDWLDQLSVDDPRLARFVCKLVPSQCPFERDVTLFKNKVVHIPPMCKINPLYDQLVGLRFRALSYLADDCGEDITPYA